MNVDGPAEVSETITLLLTGLGAVNGTARAGTRPAAALAVKARIHVIFWNATVEAISAVLSANAPGVYEVRVNIPTGIPRAPIPVRVIADGVGSNAAYLPIA